MEPETKPTVNTDTIDEIKGNESYSYLMQVLCKFKVTRLSELEVFLFGKFPLTHSPYFIRNFIGSFSN